MMLALSRPMLKQHALAALTALCIFAAGGFFLAADRADPVDFVDGEIGPQPVMPGQIAALRWHTDWKRACEGVVSREIVGADKVIKAYRKYTLRIPTQLGRQISDTDFIPAAGLPPGPAIYRAVLRFPNCGITSRIVPLELKTPEIMFTVTAK